VDWIIALLATLLIADPAPTAAPEVHGVRIAQQSARWTGLIPLDDLQGADETMFIISGEIENTGLAPVAWVKLGYELLDGSDDHPIVLASEFGYNRRAEALREIEPEAGAAGRPAPPVPPLAPGEKDLFRMVFFRADVRQFTRWRVRILEVR
jgi:hypothetical protein